jgi:hypothetical protein
MSRYATVYQDAEPNIGVVELYQYCSMMSGKRSMADFGSRLLAKYRARKGSR